MKSSPPGKGFGRRLIPDEEALPEWLQAYWPWLSFFSVLFLFAVGFLRVFFSLTPGVQSGLLLQGIAVSGFLYLGWRRFDTFRRERGLLVLLPGEAQRAIRERTPVDMLDQWRRAHNELMHMFAYVFLPDTTTNERIELLNNMPSWTRQPVLNLTPDPMQAFLLPESEVQLLRAQPRRPTTRRRPSLRRPDRQMDVRVLDVSNNQRSPSPPRLNIPSRTESPPPRPAHISPEQSSGDASEESEAGASRSPSPEVESEISVIVDTPDRHSWTGANIRQTIEERFGAIRDRVRPIIPEFLERRIRQKIAEFLRSPLRRVSDKHLFLVSLLGILGTIYWMRKNRRLLTMLRRMGKRGLFYLLVLVAIGSTGELAWRRWRNPRRTARSWWDWLTGRKQHYPPIASPQRPASGTSQTEHASDTAER